MPCAVCVCPCAVARALCGRCHLPGPRRARTRTHPSDHKASAPPAPCRRVGPVPVPPLSCDERSSLTIELRLLLWAGFGKKIRRLNACTHPSLKLRLNYMRPSTPKRPNIIKNSHPTRGRNKRENDERNRCLRIKIRFSVAAAGTPLERAPEADQTTRPARGRPGARAAAAPPRA